MNGDTPQWKRWTIDVLQGFGVGIIICAVLAAAFSGFRWML